MRFSPPRVPLPTELRWLLEAAFANELPPLGGEPAAAAELAGRFDLGPRIVARHGAAAVQDRLGAAAAEPIQAHRRGVAIALACDRTAQRLTELAAGHGLPLVFLKGYALQRMLSGPAGWRPYVDLDVLLARPAAERLRELLAAEGWSSAAEAGNPQHLPPITSPQGTPVDVHYRLRGIHVATERWATANELLEAGLCRPVAPGEGAWLPVPALMAAHVAVHGLEQHGYRPATYPLLRAVADIADLGEVEAAAELAAAASRLLGDSLGADEERAIFRLARLLAEGRPPAGEGGDEPEAETLLRHIVAGVLDPAYRRSLLLDHTAGRLRQARRERRLMRYIGSKLKGPSGTPMAVSEDSARRAGPWRRRLLQPIRLCARFASAAAARLRRAFDR